MDLQNFLFSKFLLEQYPTAIKGYTKYYILAELKKNPSIVGHKPKTPFEIQITVSNIPEDTNTRKCTQYISEHFKNIYFMKTSKHHSTRRFFHKYSKNSFRLEREYNSYSRVKRKEREFIDVPEDLDEVITSVVSDVLHKSDKVTSFHFWNWIKPLLRYVETWMTYYLFREFFKIPKNSIIVKGVEVNDFNATVQEIVDSGNYAIVFYNEDREFVEADVKEVELFYTEKSFEFLHFYLNYLENIIGPFIRSIEERTAATIIKDTIHVYKDEFINYITDELNLDTFISADIAARNLFIVIAKNFGKNEYIKYVYEAIALDYIMNFTDHDKQLLLTIIQKIKKMIETMKNDTNFNKPISEFGRHNLPFLNMQLKIKQKLKKLVDDIVDDPNFVISLKFENESELEQLVQKYPIILPKQFKKVVDIIRKSYDLTRNLINIIEKVRKYIENVIFS